MKKAYVISYTVGCIVSIAFTSLVTKRISIQDAALILPLITFFLLLFVWKKLRRKTKTIEVIMTAYATGAIIYTFLSNVSSFTLDAFSITIVVYFVLQTTFAIKSPNATQNYTFGIRNPMTLDHVEIWQRTHKFLSLLETSTLPLMFSLIFFSNGWVRFWVGTVLVLIPLVISSIYSGVIGQKYQKQIYEEKKKQEEIESGLYPWKK